MRAGPRSCLKLSGQGASDSSWRVMALEVKSMAKLTEKPSSGTSAADLPGDPTLTGFNTLMTRRGAFCSTSPAHSIRKTKGAALPSIAGTSGPSSSTTALSISSPAKAAIRCSTVAIEMPLPLASVVQSVDFDDIAPRSLDLDVAEIAAAETDAGIGRCWMEGHLDPRAAMQPDATAVDRRFQGFLRAGNQIHDSCPP